MSLVARLRELPPELRNAGIAAAALAATMFLPWYSKRYAAQVDGELRAAQDSLSAFAVFTFIEAAVLLVSAAVLFLIWARSERKGFHLPGGDGAAISIAGGWALLLLVWRLFDKPDADDPATSFGIEWGIFAAMLAAGALLAAGARVRAVHRPEPPNPAAEPEPEPGPGERPRPRPPRRRSDTAATEVLGERPEWSGEPPEPPGRARPARPRAAEPDESPTDRLF